MAIWIVCGATVVALLVVPALMVITSVEVKYSTPNVPEVLLAAAVAIASLYPNRPIKVRVAAVEVDKVVAPAMPRPQADNNKALNNMMEKSDKESDVEVVKPC